MAQRRLTASIVTYNGFAEAEDCIASVLQATRVPDFRLFLIDNASPDGTGARLRQRFGAAAEVLCLPQNKGYGGGHNSCLPLLDSRYHAVINPDVILTEDALAAICDWMDAHPDVAMVTPRLLGRDGAVQNIAKRRPSFMALLARQLPWAVLRPYETYYLMLDRDLGRPQDVEFCSGCFFVMRTDVLRAIGGFDEDYFMYVEDADITRRALRCGRAVYLPSVSVCHLWHRAARRSRKHFFMQLRSMMLYFRKWGFRLGLRDRARPFEKDAE